MNILHEKFIQILLSCLVGFLAFGLSETNSNAQAIQQNPIELKGVDVTEHLGERIPLDLAFTNDAGEQVKLGQYFKQGKPVIIILAYYRCPMLCTLVMNGMADGLRQLNWIPGKEFQVLTISIDSTETFEMAAAKKGTILPAVGKNGIENGWRFFVGHGDQIRSLAEAIGFHYYYDRKQEMYAHPAIATILTSDGVISRYLYGIEFKKQDLRLSLLEASEGKIGTTLDRIILYCYHYNPGAKGYVLFAANVMKVGGMATLLILAIFLAILWIKDQGRKSTNAVA